MVVPSAPERISIKRRRNDEPLDHLLYQSKKQRTSDHVFVRLPLLEARNGFSSRTSEAQPSPANSSVTTGIPTVKTTLPGDEVNDFKKYLTGNALQTHSSESPDDQQPGHKRSGSVRRFHLTRDLSTQFRPESSSVPQPTKSGIRPHLPTFVERHDVPSTNSEQIYVKPPIDRLIEHHETGDFQSAFDRRPAIDKTLQKQEVSTFRQPHTSFHDDDDLADELAALAMELDKELDPEVKAAFLEEQQTARQDRQTAISANIAPDHSTDDYIFETYVRIRPESDLEAMLNIQTRSFGYLVVDDDHEDLWQQYLKDDDDSEEEWDEEDEDSNAEENPRNDYPDEEVSSDDEFGYNAYKYRRYCSDDEQYDDDH